MEKWQNRWNFSNRGRFYHNFHHQVKTKNLHDFPNKKFQQWFTTSDQDMPKFCHKLNITDSANCQCGERETIEHYILHCDQYEEAREKLIHDMFLLSGSMHLSLEVLLTSRSRWRSFTNGNGTNSTSSRLYTGNQTLRFLIYLLFSTVIILFTFILFLYQCPPIKSSGVLKLPSVNCTCA